MADWLGSLKSLTRRKSGELILGESQDDKKKLKRVLGSFDLFMPGIGGITGAGIFALWLLAGLFLYFVFGFRKSRIRKELKNET